MSAFVRPFNSLSAPARKRQSFLSHVEFQGIVFVKMTRIREGEEGASEADALNSSHLASSVCSDASMLTRHPLRAANCLHAVLNPIRIECWWPVPVSRVATKTLAIDDDVQSG